MDMTSELVEQEKFNKEKLLDQDDGDDKVIRFAVLIKRHY